MASPQYNLDLSQRRAAAVKSYLQAGGVNGSRLSTVGFGASRPVASNETPVGRALNRRVELVRQ
jgi:outer membrane protein OmpA-like peptidoglycan-associated protein